MTTMTVSAFLLLLSLPSVLGRLGEESKETEVVRTRELPLNETFGQAVNEIRGFYSNDFQHLKSQQGAVDAMNGRWNAKVSFDNDGLGLGFNNETLPTFEFLSQDDLDELEKHIVSDTATRESRDLSGTLSVTIENQCQETIWLSLIYRNTAGSLVSSNGWVQLSSGHRVDFTVSDHQYYMYATSGNGRYTWDGDSSYCFQSGSCYEHFVVSSSSTSYSQYLYCNGGSPPSPSPPSPSPPVSGDAATGRDANWLDSHNTRRVSFHTQRGKSARNLVWSNDLASSAQGYANSLVSVGGSSDCYIAHNYGGDSYGGENIAANWGSSSSPPTTESILYRWFEGEAGDDWPANGHRTQVAWYGTSYVGCGEARKAHDMGHCHIQVCRYLAPGNCNVGSTDLDTLIMQDSTPCGPQSPSS